MILFLYILYQFINKLRLSFFEKQIKEQISFILSKTATSFFIPLHKIGCTSAIQASLIAFGLHNLCIRLAAPQQFKQT